MVRVRKQPITVDGSGGPGPLSFKREAELLGEYDQFIEKTKEQLIEMEYLDDEVDEEEEEAADPRLKVEINQDLAGALDGHIREGGANAQAASSDADKKALVQKISLSNQSLLEQLERLTHATRQQLIKFDIAANGRAQSPQKPNQDNQPQ